MIKPFQPHSSTAVSRKMLLATILSFMAIGISVSFLRCAPAPLSGTLQVQEARSQKLMALAADEAGKISEPDMRLTRQLNLADLQINRNWNSDARATLAAARKTLASPEAVKLNDHARLSGWVSVSELSRRIDDKAGAALATDAAMKALDGIDDPARRCEYVMGLANELQYIKGKPAAAGLLARAGPWTKSIDPLPLRRQALIAFSTALFNLDDFGAGQTMLGYETDPAWRSDILAGMAQIPRDTGREMDVATARGGRAGNVAASMAPPSPADSQQAIQPFYGKNLNYDQVFKNQRSSQTSKD